MPPMPSQMRLLSFVWQNFTFFIEWILTERTAVAVSTTTTEETYIILDYGQRRCYSSSSSLSLPSHNNAFGKHVSSQNIQREANNALVYQCDVCLSSSSSFIIITSVGSLCSSVHINFLWTWTLIFLYTTSILCKNIRATLHVHFHGHGDTFATKIYFLANAVVATPLKWHRNVLPNA